MVDLLPNGEILRAAFIGVIHLEVRQPFKGAIIQGMTRFRENTVFCVWVVTFVSDYVEDTTLHLYQFQSGTPPAYGLGTNN